MSKKDRDAAKLLSMTLIALIISVMTTAPNEFMQQHAVNETVVSRMDGDLDASFM